MAFARVFGDRLTERWGVAALDPPRRAARRWRESLLALATRSPVPAIVGFACVGAGVATVVPAVFRVAAVGHGDRRRRRHRRRSRSPATAARVANGPAIGFVARGIGLTGALGLLVVACALVAAARAAARAQ